MIVMPLILVSMVAAVVRMDELSTLGRIGGMVVGILVATTVIAATIGAFVTLAFGLSAEGLTEGARELERAEELVERLSEHESLDQLARIPVLLNMICFIYMRRGGRLPDGRAELYQRIAETYLTSLDQARGVRFRDRKMNFDYLGT